MKCNKCGGTVNVTKWQPGYWLCHWCKSEAAEKIWAQEQERSKLLKALSAITSAYESELAGLDCLRKYGDKPGETENGECACAVCTGGRLVEATNKLISEARITA